MRFQNYCLQNLVSIDVKKNIMIRSDVNTKAVDLISENLAAYTLTLSFTAKLVNALFTMNSKTFFFKCAFCAQ